MRTLLIALLFALPLAADELKVECETDTCAVWYTGGGALGNTHLDVSASTDFTTHNETTEFPHGSGTTFSGQVTLAAGTWYLRVHSATQGVIDCSAVTTFSGDGTCTSTVIQVSATASAAGGLSPTLDFSDIRTWRENVCEGAASGTYTVDSSGSGCRANFDTAIASARTAWEANTATIQSIEIDPATCKEGVLGTGNEATHFEFASFAADDAALGGLRIMTDAAAGILPPAGVRIDPSYRDSIVRFGPAINLRYFGSVVSGTAGVWKLSSGNAHHICFVAMEIGRPDPGEVYYTRPITGASGLNTLTIGGGGLPDGHHNGTRFLVECDTDTGGWSGLRSCGGTCGDGDTSLQLNITADDNSCTSGTVYWAPTGAEISTVSATGLLTIVGSSIPFINYPDLDIDVVTDGAGTATITLNSAMPTPSGTRVLAVGDVVYFQGTGTSLDTSPVVISAVASDTEFTVSTDAGSDCLTDCAGTVRLMKPLVIDYSTDDAVNGVHYALKTSATTLQLLDPSDFSNLSLAGEATGGWLSYEPYTARGNTIELTQDILERFAFDRILFNPLAFPSRDPGEPFMSGSWQNPDNISVVNSYGLPQEEWGYKDPVTGDFDVYQGNPTSLPTAQFWQTNNIQSWEFVNNALPAAHGIIVGADDGTSIGSGEQLDKRDFSRNDVHQPQRWLSPDTSLSPNTEWTGRTHDNRHVWEIKTGCEARGRGNSLYRNFGTAAGSVTQPFIFKAGGAGSDLSLSICAGDYLVDGNIAFRTGGLVAWGGITNPGNRGLYGPVEASYNWTGSDGRTNAVLPNNGGGSNFGGAMFRSSDIARSIWIHHNTQAFGLHQNVGGEFLSLDRLSGKIVVENNIFPDQDTPSGTSILGNIDGNNGWGSINCTTVDSALIECAGSTPDGDDTQTKHVDTAFDGNVVWPGLENASQAFSDWIADMALTSDAVRKTYTETNAEWGSSELDGTANVIACNGAATYNACVATIFPTSGSWDPGGAYDGKGAEPAEIQKRRGYWTMTPTLLTATSFKVDFTNPVDHDDLTTALPCYVDYSTDATLNSGVTRVNAGTDGTETISGLAAATTYYVRVSCAGGGPGRYIRPITTGGGA